MNLSNNNRMNNKNNDVMKNGKSTYILENPLKDILGSFRFSIELLAQLMDETTKRLDWA